MTSEGEREILLTALVSRCSYPNSTLSRYATYLKQDGMDGECPQNCYAMLAETKGSDCTDDMVIDEMFARGVILRDR